MPLNRESASAIFLFAALALGAVYWIGAISRSGFPIPYFLNFAPEFVIVWKSVATGGLVMSAFLAANSSNLRRLAAVLMIIWIADGVLAFGYTVHAGVIFAAAHLFAVWTLLQMRPSADRGRAAMIISGSAIALFFCAFIAVILLQGPIVFAAFPFFSCLATIAASRSAMPVHLTLLGYAVFLASDVTFVVTMSLPSGALPFSWLVWLTYFSGLALLVRGIQQQAALKLDLT